MVNVPRNRPGEPATGCSRVWAHSGCQSPGQPSSDWSEPTSATVVGTAVWFARAAEAAITNAARQAKPTRRVTELHETLTTPSSACRPAHGTLIPDAENGKRQGK